RNQHPEQTCTRGLRGINACGDGCMSNRNEAGSPVTCSGEEVTSPRTKLFMAYTPIEISWNPMSENDSSGNWKLLRID
ncbi:MAG: hypothetical protein U9N12_06630, partial [Euryarchaeota archaeon]|nr:hypothetical protein [Euryarchaeota archaeon]